MLRPDFALQGGEYVVTASKDDKHCHLSRVPLHGPPTRRDCSLELAEVLHTLADMGCQYPEAVTLLQQADSAGVLSCRVRCDALPQYTTVYELAKLGQNKSGSADSDAELVPAGQDLGVTPTLFDNGLSSLSSRLRQQQMLLNDAKSGKEGQAAGSPE